MPTTIVIGPARHAEALREAGLPPDRTLQFEAEGARVERTRGGIQVTTAAGIRATGDALVLAGDLRVCLAALYDPTTHEQKLLSTIDADGDFPGVDDAWTFDRQLAAIAGERRTWHFPGEAHHAAASRIARGVLHHRSGVGEGVGGPRVAVLGGGAAGLATAHLLEKRGIRATVYEASGRLGGKCRSVRVGQVRHDVGGCFTTPDYHIGPLASFESNDNVIDLAALLVPRIVDAVR